MTGSEENGILTRIRSQLFQGKNVIWKGIRGVSIV